MTRDTSSMTRRHRVQYLAVNALAWVCLLVVGGALIFAAARISRAHIRTADIQARVEAGLNVFRQGDVLAAQQQLLNIIRAHPSASSIVLNHAENDLLGMPQVYTALRSDASIKGIDRVRLLLLSGDTIGAVAMMEGLDSRDALPREGYLWWARILLDQGDVEGAQVRFGNYWQGHGHEREKATAALLEDDRLGRSLPEQFYALLWTGLWEEAFALTADEENNLTEDTALLRALEADLKGAKSEALQQYQAILKTTPNNRLSRQRAEALASPTAVP